VNFLGSASRSVSIRGLLHGDASETLTIASSKTLTI
jgi:hypothetical protein